jgi:hypothetical protein
MRKLSCISSMSIENSFAVRFSMPKEEAPDFVVSSSTRNSEQIQARIFVVDTDHALLSLEYYSTRFLESHLRSLVVEIVGGYCLWDV